MPSVHPPPGSPERSPSGGHRDAARATISALAGGAALGFGFEEIVGVVAALTPRDFYKSMTTHTDHRIWQDVYRPTSRPAMSI